MHHRSFLRAYTAMTAAAALALAVSACAPQTATEEPLSLSEQDQNLMRVAASARSAGNLDSAAELYAQFIERNRGSVAGHLELASVQRQKGNRAGAVETLRAAQKIQPDNAEVLAALGMALVSDNHPKEAIAVFDQALSRPGLAENAKLLALNGQGVALDRMGEHAEAQEAYAKVLAADPENIAARNNQGLSQILAGDYAAAAKTLEPLAALPEASSTLRQNLALAYGLMGDKSRAMELGLKDLPSEQAQQNLRFYDYYRSHKLTAAAQAVPVIPVKETPVKAAPASSVAEQSVPVKAAEAPAPEAPKPEEQAKSPGPESRNAPEGLTEEEQQAKAPAADAPADVPAIDDEMLSASETEMPSQPAEIAAAAEKTEPAENADALVPAAGEALPAATDAGGETDTLFRDALLGSAPNPTPEKRAGEPAFLHDTSRPKH